MDRFDVTTPAWKVMQILFAYNQAIGALTDNFAPGSIPNFEEEADLAMLRGNRDNVAQLLGRLDESFIP
jgi:hypothetical protein